MLQFITDLFDESAPDRKARLVTIYSLLLALNAGAWVWAFLAFQGYAVTAEGRRKAGSVMRVGNHE